MMDSKTAVNWDEYLERYADFINRNRIDKFFGLDIDVVVGYDEVVRLRQQTGKPDGGNNVSRYGTKAGDG